MKKTFIFDFDGTLADTFEDTISILYDISQHSKYSLSKSFIRNELRTKHIREIISDFSLSPVHLTFFLWKIRRELFKKKEKIFPIVSIKEILFKLHERRYNLILITSNSQVTVDHFLEQEGLCIFSEIYYKAGLFSKYKIINKVIKKHNFDKKEIFYIGDEIRDICCAKKSQVNSVSVTWGYNSKNLLKEENPNYIVDSPYDLLKI